MAPTEWIIAVGSAVNAVSVAVLVCVTIRYARTTAALLEESRKARAAAERQAAAAEGSIRFLKQELEIQAGLSKTIVSSAMQSAMRNVEYWKAQDLFNMASTRTLPDTIDLLPGSYQAAAEHARRISQEGSLELSSALDHLKLARTEIEILKAKGQTSVEFYAQHAQRVCHYLEIANAELDSAAQCLRNAVMQQAEKG